MAGNPFDQFDATPGPVYGAPDPSMAFRQNAEARAQQDQSMQIANMGRTAENDAARIRIEQERLQLAKDAAAREAAKTPSTAKAANMDSLIGQLNRVTKLYNEGISQEGALNLWGALDAIGPQASQFNSAGQGVADQALASFRVPGMGAQSDLEARQFASANTPQAGDWDVAIEEKIMNLRRRIDAQREAQGLPAADWAEFNPGLIVNPEDNNNPAPAAAASTTPGGGSGGGGGGIMEGLAQGTGSLVEGALSLPALAIDPIATTLGRALGYDNYTSDFAGQVRSDLGLPANQNRTSDAIIKGGVGALAGAGLARGASSLVGSAPVRNALATFGAAPTRDALAGATAAAGGEIGREVGGVPGQIVGTLAGGVGGYTGANALANAFGGTRTPNALLSAADSLGVQMLPADVGGVGTRMASGATRMTLGGIPMAEGAERSIATAANARNRIASDIGDVADEAGVGQAVRRGFKDFTKSSEQRAAQLYERVSVPSESKVQLSNTRQALGDVTRGLQSNPELSKLWANHPRLRSTLEALTPEDTRQAGQVQLSYTTDRLRGAEEALAQAKQRASGNLSFEQSQARDAADAARRQYDNTLMQARDEAAAAQQQFTSISAQRGLTSRVPEMERAAKAAQDRYSALARRDPENPEVATLLGDIQKADAGFNSVRFREPMSDAVQSAQKAVDDAKAAVDESFIMSRQPPQGGELSWQDMKRFRSIVGEIVGQPGVAADGSDVAGLRKLYGALSSDMEVTAAQAGPKALQEFKRANQYWRGRENRLENVFEGLFGNRDQRSDEAVFRTINQWAQSKSGDFSRLARTIRSMPEDEANTVRATVIQKMGEATPANGGSEVFTPDVFATQWKSLSPRAKTILFPNKQHRQDLESLATVTDAMKRAGEYRNTSKTGLAANFTAQGALAYANLPAAVMLAGSQFGIGKLLASPRFARALASSSRLPETQGARKLDETLKVIATRDPALAADARGLQEYLRQMTSPTTRVAASEQEQDTRREPVQ